MKKSDKILITGASGFIGQALVKKLLATKAKLFLVTRDKKFKCPGAKVFYGDLADPAFCQKIVKDIDTVYYLAAAKKNIAVHTQEPFAILAGNVFPLLTFLAAAKTSRIKKIIYVSSVLVDYAFSPGEKIDGYVWGKQISELVLHSFAIETKIEVKIARSAAVYGPGDNFDSQTANFIPALIRRVTEAKTELMVWGKGQRRLQFIYLDDLIANLVAANNRPGNFFRFGHSHVVSVNQVVNKIVTLLDKKLKIRHDLSKPDKSTQLFKFNNLIKPRVSLDIGLKTTFAYFKKYV